VCTCISKVYKLGKKKKTYQKTYQKFIMRFKTSALKESKHTELVSCVAWMSTDDVVSISDDKKILKWNLVNSETKANLI
jgi:WD40 repeat protein